MYGLYAKYGLKQYVIIRRNGHSWGIVTVYNMVPKTLVAGNNYVTQKVLHAQKNRFKIGYNCSRLCQQNIFRCKHFFIYVPLSSSSYNLCQQLTIPNSTNYLEKLILVIPVHDSCISGALWCRASYWNFFSEIFNRMSKS